MQYLMTNQLIYLNLIIKLFKNLFNLELHLLEVECLLFLVKFKV